MMFPDYQRVDNAAAHEKFEAAWGVTLDPKPGLTVVEIVGSALKGGVRGHVHDGREPVPLGPEHQQGPQGARRARVPRRAGHLPHRDGRVRRRGPARPRRSWRRTGPTRTPTGACRSAARCSTRPARRGPTGRSSARSRDRIGLPMEYESVERGLRRDGRALARLQRASTTATSGRPASSSPNPDPEHSDGTVVLFDESFPTDDGKAHLVPAEWMPAKELPDEEYPFVLNTGRLLEHWHTGSMTRRSFALDAIQPAAMVVHPEADAARMGIADGDFVRVTSRRGSIELAAKVSHRETPGLVLHPVPLPRGGGEPADDRRDRPVREDPRVQVLRRRSSRPAAADRCPTRQALRERADGEATAASPASRRARASSPARR